MIFEEPLLETHGEIEQFLEKLTLEETSRTFSNLKYVPVDDSFGDSITISLDKCKVVFDISKYNKLVVKVSPKDLPLMKKLDAKLHSLLKHDEVNVYQSFLGKNGDCVSVKVDKESEFYGEVEKIKQGKVIGIAFSFSKCCKINKHTYASFELVGITS